MRHKILEILVETPALGARALAEKIGVSRQHVAYHIGELEKTGLIKHAKAGSIVVYHITELGRTILQRIHSVSPRVEDRPAKYVSARSTPPPTKVSHLHGPVYLRVLGLAPALAGVSLLIYSVIRAYTDQQPSYVLGGVMIFLLLAYVSRKVSRWWPEVQH